MSSAAPARSFAEVLDGLKTTRLQVVVALACGAVAFCDAYGIQAVNYAGPSLRAALRLSAAELGAVFSVSLFGMMIGGFIVGPAADRLGRRGPMIVCTLACAALTALTVLVTSFWQLAVLRLLAGMALGAALPNAYVLAAEFSPTRSRRLTISLLMAGYTGGGLAAGLLAAPLIAHSDWRAVFLAGAAAALAAAVFAWVCVPESPAILVATRQGRLRLARLVQRISPGSAIDLDAPFAPPSRRGLSVAILFSRTYRKVTGLLWAIAFSVMLCVYLYLSWTPVIVHDRGIALSTAVLITAVFNIGTVVSAVTAGWLMDRFNPGYCLVGFLLFGAAALAAITFAPSDAQTLEIVSFLIGLGLGGGLGGMNLLATTVYPGEARVTGSGWAISVGRLGSVAGPALGAAWLTAGRAGSEIYVWLAPMLVLVALLTARLAGEVSPKP